MTGIYSWRQDKNPEEINTPDDLKELLNTYNQQPALDIDDANSLNTTSK